MRLSKTIVAVVAISCALDGCALTRGVRAWMQPDDGFAGCTTDPRILCEPGSEALANSILPLLPGAIAKVEREHYASFAVPVVIRTYATRESFSRHSGVPDYAEGAASFGVIHLSPKLLTTPERTKGILTHELSHLELLLALGAVDAGKVPGWFDEGYATFVSGGGGAETVSAAGAAEALVHGARFEPDAAQWFLFPKNASSYGLAPHMYYRQAALFVGYLHDSDPPAFERMVRGVLARQPFAQAVESSYREPVAAIWQRFLASLGAAAAAGHKAPA